MKNKNLFLFLTICAVLIIFVIFTAPSYASPENNRKTFSFRFENCTVVDALRQVSEKSGIDIISKGILKKEILSKSYINRSLDKIITDLLRGENCAVVWNYENGNLYSIGLYAPDKDDIKGAATNPTAIKRTNTGNERTVFTGNRNRNKSKLFTGSTTRNKANKNRNTYVRNKETNSSARSITTFPTSRAPSNKSSLNITHARNNTVSRTSSGVSTNIQRTVINRQNNVIAEEEEEKKPQPSPVLPEPKKENRLERPPMPPGL